MLKTLRRIVQEVNSAHDFGEALNIMVQRIKEAVATQACSVFLIDKQSNEYVLMATEGLNTQSVGKIRLRRDQGLIGLIGQREEPINLDNAPEHPNFLYHPKAGEEKYKAFLGVPIIHQRALLGVLIVQQEESRRFDEAEEAFLVTLSAQLAGVIAHAEATGLTHRLLHATNVPTPATSLALTGIPSSPGIAIGTCVVAYPLAELKAVPDRPAKSVNKEIALFKKALAAARSDIHAMSDRLSKNLPAEEHALFDVYLRILDSESLSKEIIGEIQAGNWAQGALRKTIKRHIRYFESLEDDYLRERATDLRDLGQRVLLYLQSPQQGACQYPEQTILIGEEITASDLAAVPEGQLVGVVSASGSSNSHTAILARAMGIPTVMGTNGLPLVELEGAGVIVNGYNGQIFIRPTADLYKNYLDLVAQEQQLDAKLQELRTLPAETPDGHKIKLFVNTGLTADVGLALSAGAEGVGLYRTETPFMTRDRFPAEEEQRVLYRQLLNAFAPRPVTMRTLDIGGDKALPYFPVKEDNPFLGWRGIRITLDHPEVFLVQVRAMLRASDGLNNLQIMLPMISGVNELNEALRLFNQAYQEIKDEGLDIVKPLIGVMIEIPSAVYQTYALAQRVDFLSIGSNDLTQYMLAVDRNNARVANLYDSLHPAVLHALVQAVQGAHQANKPIGICGEMTSDPIAVILLIGMGFDMLSMNSTSLLKIKWVIRKFTKQKARQLLQETLQMESPNQIRSHLTQALIQAGLGSLINVEKH